VTHAQESSDSHAFYPAGKTIHAGGDNTTNCSTWRLHCYTESKLALHLPGDYSTKEGFTVDPEVTAFPSANVCAVAGVSIGQSGIDITPEQMDAILEKVLTSDE